MLTRPRSLFALLAVIAAVAAPAVAVREAPPATPTPATELAALTQATGGNIRAHFFEANGAYDHVRALGRAVLERGDTGADPETRAFAFLGRHGAVTGMSPAEMAAAAARAEGRRIGAAGSELRVKGVETDPAKKTHVRLEQMFDGMPVFGAQIVVHMDGRGVYAVSGAFVPGIEPASPTVGERAAVATAVGRVRTEVGEADLRARETELQMYNEGIAAGRPMDTRLAWVVEVTGDQVREQVLVDAATGDVLEQIPLQHRALDRCAYSPRYEETNPERFVIRKEGDPPTHITPVDNLYDFTGYTYDLFFKGFGRDSYDGAGIKMRTVYLVNDACPNAYWDGFSTNYCPGFDIDDVVSHEWTHAFTEFTHGLIYRWQAGALNESYSDIYGELVDLLDTWDGIGGSNNSQPYPDGQRWLVGEDLTQPVADALKLRDMWNPERVGLPAKVSSPSYVCGPESNDGGGVHLNSSVPNHAFAMLVDGKTFNGQTVGAIGMTKAAHVYYRAIAYQTPTTTFAQHAAALASACQDLATAGTDLNGLTTGAPSGEVMTQNDCFQVDKAMLAVEMASPPEQCGFRPLLDPAAPPPCGGGSVVFSEDWEDGLSGWTLASEGRVIPPSQTPPLPDTDGNDAELAWPGWNWTAVGALPGGRPGQAIFAIDHYSQGDCRYGPDVSGHFSAESQQIVIPPGAPRALLRLDHWVATQTGVDGGNVMLKVGSEAYKALPANAFVFNPPTGNLSAATNPKTGQPAWSGSNAGAVTGSWGTSIADLSAVVPAGEPFRLKLDFGVDCGNGRVGWFVDDLSITLCPALPAPVLRLGSDYGNPETDGTYTLEWARPFGATGPETLQEAGVTAPIMIEDAQDGLAGWTAASTSPFLGWESSDGKAGHSSKTFFSKGSELAWVLFTGKATLTRDDPVAIPATGETVLTFKSWAMNEPDDTTAVDVSTDSGVSWKPVWVQARSAPNSVPGGAQAEAQALSEPLTPVTVSLASFAGETIRIRLRYEVGPTNYVALTPLGWHVDDIEVRNLLWTDLVTTSDASYTVMGRAVGEYLYRVRSTFTFDATLVPSDWSAVKRAKVTAA